MTKRLNITQLVISATMVIFGIALLAASFYVPPLGYIDPTVLAAYGETLTFVGAIIGIDFHYKAKQDPPTP